MSHSKKILVIGAGYVGLAYACFFAQKHQVTILDTDESKVKSISDGISYSNEDLIQEFIEKYNKNISSITNLDDFFEFDCKINKGERKNGSRKEVKKAKWESKVTSLSSRSLQEWKWAKTGGKNLRGKNCL